ncbi:MAG: hypothetical protein HY555_03335 [Euryarchaeota archaeon]|nr:hypothetical protein [Euryarchaeota archaeon]
MKAKVDPEELLRIIALCRAVERRGVDPFQVDVGRSIEKLRRYLPRWRLPEELLLDAEALNRIAAIVRLQGDWLKHRASALYIDPILVELKIRMLEPERLASVFFRSWHPIVALEQLSEKRLEEGLDYWNSLLPLAERLREEAPSGGELGLLTREDLVNLRTFSEVEFKDLLKKILEELRAMAKGGKVSYREFIYRGTFAEAVERAYLTSFLVTDGYVELDVKHLEEEIFLRPLERPIPLEERTKVYSVPVPLDYRED